jgi:(2R)-sulfolactate sulfo-lyase subunit beta
VSGLLAREYSLAEAGARLLRYVDRVINGRPTCAEALGHREFVITKLYRSA